MPALALESASGIGVEWDDDGYLEIDYHRPDGAKVEVEIDPVTGEVRG